MQEKEERPEKFISGRRSCGPFRTLLPLTSPFLHSYSLPPSNTDDMKEKNSPAVPAVESDDEDVIEEVIRNTDDIIEQIKYFNLKSNTSFEQQCANLIELFSEDPNAFKDTDRKYICDGCSIKFGTVKFWPCQDSPLCRQCIVKHFQSAGSITLAGLACPRCHVPVTFLTRGHIDDEVLNPPSGKYANVALPKTFFFHHHDIYCRIYGCSGNHKQHK